MKLQKLKIHNIASIEDAEIDFEKTPLSDSELFLITGKTGSGKSTILDSICLALYASTPRLENTKMQGATKDKDQKVTVSDPRQLLRRNTGEGYVRLAFIGTDKIPYEAEWSVRRARNNASGNLQSKSWSLKNLSTNELYTKDTDIKQAMATAIGLTFEQFCRTTMLAQGEFTRFLNSDDKDKAAILEKITGVNIYSEIGAAIYSITSEKQATYKEAQMRADSIDIPSEEVIKELENEQEQYAVQQKNLEDKRQMISAKLSWLHQYAAVLTHVSEAEAAVAAANEQIRSQEYLENSQLVKDWNASSDARESYISLVAAEQEKERMETKMHAYMADFERLKSACGWEADRLAASKDVLESLKSELDKSLAYSELYQNEQTVSAHLHLLAQAYASIEKETANLSVLDESLQKAVAMKEEKKGVYDHEEVRFKIANDELNVAEVHLCEYDLPTYRKSYEAYTKRLNLLTTASSAITTYTDTLASYNDTQGQIASIQVHITEKQIEFDAIAVSKEKAEVAKNVAFEICEKQKAGVDQWAKAVRATLSVNDECPVCRHKIDVLPTEDEVDRIYAIAYDAYRQALDVYDGICSKANIVAAELQAFKKQIAGLQDTLKRNDDRVKQSGIAAAAALQCIGLELVDEVENEVKKHIEETGILIDELAAKIEVGEEMERSVTLKRSALNTVREAKDNALKALEDSKNVENRIRQLIAASEAVIADKNKGVADTVAVLESLVGDSGCIDIDWRIAPEAYRKELHIIAEKYVALQHSVSDAEQNVQSIQSNYDSLTQVATQIVEDMPEWGNITPMSKTKLEDPVRKANTLLAESRTCKEQIEDVCQRIFEYKAEISQFLGNQEVVDQARLVYLAEINLAKITELSKNLEEIRTSVAAAKSALAEHNRSLTLLENDKPMFDDGEVRDTLEAALHACTDELRILSENKGAVEQKLKQISDDKQKVGHLQDEINACRAVWEKWDRLNSHFGDATGAKFRKIAQSYVLANLIRAANAYMKTLSDRYTLAVEPGEFVIMVEDAYQGYAHRAVSTISGGESFLVSLSLALALSDIGHTLAVDILFIDEGFGTLSGDPLMNAIGTLKTLHRKSGRKVGIISHVEELKEKVPVQIQVQQEGNSSKSTIKIV